MLAASTYFSHFLWFNVVKSLTEAMSFKYLANPSNSRSFSLLK